MRRMRCAVKTCKNVRSKEGSDLVFYTFQRGREEAWAEAIGRPELISKFKTKKSNCNVLICADHFREDDFEPTLNDFFNLNWRPRLKPGAIPSLKLNPLPPVEQTEERSAGGDDGDEDLLPGDEKNTVMELEGGEEFPEETVERLCLICSEIHRSSPTMFFSSLPEFQLPGSSDFPLLNEQLLSTFILRRVLELPVWKFEDILKTAGTSVQPGNWFVVCENCAKTVVQILTNQEQIGNLQKEIDNLFKTLRGKFRDSSTTSKDLLTDNVTGTLDCREEIRSFLLGNKSKPQPRLRKKPASQRNKDLDLSDDESMSQPATPDSAKWDANWSPGEIKEEEEGNQGEDWNPGSRSESECSWPLEIEDPVDDENLEGENMTTIASPEELTYRPHHHQKKSKYKKHYQKEFSCKLCPRKYSSELIFKRHMQLHRKSKNVANGRYDCSMCGAPYDNYISVYYHIRKDHKRTLNSAWEASGEPQKDYIYSNKTKKSVVAKLKAKAKRKGISFSAGPRPKGPMKLKAKYLCEICPRKFTLQGYLNKHLKFHEHTKARYSSRYDCARCKAPFLNCRTLKLHYRSEHSLSLDSNWETSNGSQEDFLTVIGDSEKDDKMDAWRKGNNSDSEQDKNDGEKFICSECSKSFKSINGLNTHKNRVHNVKEKEICEMCGVEVGSKAIMKQHIFNHKIFDNSVDPSVSTTELICNICKQLFQTRRQLSVHKVNNHADELGLEVYRCDQCPRVFSRKNFWMGHYMKIHKKMGIYKCDKCEYQAINRAILGTHMAKHRDADVICQYCSATYSSDGVLRAHIQRYHPEKFVSSRRKKLFVGVPVEKLSIEEGTPSWDFTFRKRMSEKPINCKYCDAVLPHKLAFNYHLKESHKDMYKFPCSQCDKVYMSVTSLNLHVKVIHKEKSKAVKCAWCLKKVSHRLYLYSHVKVCPNKPKDADTPKILAIDAENDNDGNSVEGQTETTPAGVAMDSVFNL